MAEKRNRWLVITVSVLAIAGFLALLVLPILGNRVSQPSSGSNSVASTASATDPRSELEKLAQGYAKVLEREPSNITALQGLIDARIQLNDQQGVVEPLEKLAELQPTEPNYRILLGQAKQQLGDLEGAAQAYRSVLTASPGNMNALQGLVALLIEQKRPQAAVGLLQDTLKTAKQANQVQPGSVDVISVKLLLAQVFVEQSNFANAIALYDETIAEAGQDFRPLLAKALVLQQQGKNEEAKPLFDNALKLAPDRFKDQIQQLIAASSVNSTPGTTSVPTIVPDNAAPESTPTQSAPATTESQPTGAP